MLKKNSSISRFYAKFLSKTCWNTCYLQLFHGTVLYVVATYHRRETFLGNNYNQKPKKKSRITNFVTMYQKGKILQNCPDPNACHANDANTYYV